MITTKRLVFFKVASLRFARWEAPRPQAMALVIAGNSAGRMNAGALTCRYEGTIDEKLRYCRKLISSFPTALE
jgi:hypothetical protein